MVAGLANHAAGEGSGDLPPGALRRLGRPYPICDSYAQNAVALSPDGKLAAWTWHSGEVFLADVATGTERRRLVASDFESTPRREAHSIAFVGTALVVTGGDDKAVRFFDLATGKEQGRLDLENEIRDLSVVGSTVGVALGPGTTLRTFDATTRREKRTYAPEFYGRHDACALSPDGAWIAYDAPDGDGVALSDARTGKPRAFPTSTRERDWARGGGIVFSPGANLVYRATRSRVVCRDVASGKLEGELVVPVPPGHSVEGTLPIPHGERAPWIFALALSADGTTLALGQQNGTIRIVDALKLEDRFLLDGHAQAVVGLALSADASLLVSSSRDGTVRFWDLKTRKEIRGGVGHTQTVTCVVFSADGKHVVTGSEDRTARIWDVATGEETARLVHAFPIRAVECSVDEPLVATSVGAEVRIFDLGTGAEHDERTLAGRSVRALGFLPGGKQLRTLCSDGDGRHSVTAVQIWKTDGALEKETTLEGHDGRESETAAFAPAGELVAAFTRTHALELRSVEDGLPGRTIPPGTVELGETESSRWVTFSADSKLLAACWVSGVRVVRARTGEVVFSNHDRSSPFGALSPAGDRIALWAYGADVRVAATKDGRALGVLRFPDGKPRDGRQACSCAFSLDGKTLAVGYSDGAVLLWPSP
jgi:WD40 repeat protein